MRTGSRDFIRLLTALRWLAVAGQLFTVAFVVGAMQVPLPVGPLMVGVGILAAFNLWASWRARRGPDAPDAELGAYLAVDVAVLAWQIAWSGGIENPFASLFLLPIALASFALPTPAVWRVAAFTVVGYALAVGFGRPLPHVHGAFGDVFDIHKLGMGVNFAVSAAVVLVFFARFAAAWRAREVELAALRERFARNEGIVALATHAASVAHELNTPLATMTLLADELLEDSAAPSSRRELTLMRQLIDDCRDRVRALASPAHAPPGDELVDLASVIERWRLVRPTIELDRHDSADAMGPVSASIGHLLLALLNNAADASENAGVPRVELRLATEGGDLVGHIRDFGVGFDDAEPSLPSRLFRTSKPDGLGIGLALSHATVERLGGSLSMQGAAEGRGVVVSFRLPVAS